MAKTAASTTRESATATPTTRESVTTTSTTRESATTATSVSLGPLEDRVMRALWSTQAELSAREVRDHLAEQGDELAYTTVATVLSNVYAKALVDRRRQGRVWQYWATGTCSDLAAAQMHRGLEVSRHRERTWNCFISSLDSEDLKLLRNALQRYPNRPEI